MESYIRGLALWDVIENDVDITPFIQNPTIAQKRKMPKIWPKEQSLSHASTITKEIVTSIMSCAS